MVGLALMLATCEGLHGLWAPLPDKCVETIDTDRPHQTDTPHVVAAGHTQIESAVVSAQLGGTIDGTDKATHAIFFEDNYKFGIVNRIDFQILFKHADYSLDAARFLAPGPLVLRVKLNLVEEHGAMPAITLVPTMFLPMASSQPLRAGPLMFWGWELPGGFELEMNAGLLFQPAPRPPIIAVLASALTHHVAGPVSGFVDIYATGWDIQLGTGFLVPITRNIQLDAGAYLGLSGATYVATPFLGFSIRR